MCGASVIENLAICWEKILPYNCNGKARLNKGVALWLLKSLGRQLLLIVGIVSEHRLHTYIPESTDCSPDIF